MVRVSLHALVPGVAEVPAHRARRISELTPQITDLGMVGLVRLVHDRFDGILVEDCPVLAAGCNWPLLRAWLAAFGKEWSRVTDSEQAPPVLLENADAFLLAAQSSVLPLAARAGLQVLHLQRMLAYP